MAVPLRQKASDGPDRNRNTGVALRWHAHWDSGAISAAEARAAVGSFLDRVCATGGITVPRRVAQDAQLVVSELITNVIRHAPGACGLRLEVWPDSGLVQISVWDTSPRPPRPRPHDGRRVGGHGLEIVKAVSHSLTVTDRALGKQVTAQLLMSPVSPTG
ncbi:MULTISPECIES: ATP-binding protein [unclassified Streptomyces]|uniref:ATP-binding protein n=1 Tax=unclassified Streptomyces TaxID=2593676 RepID=UPI0001D06126|nr:MULTISPECIES: ATP-binding protein [unclassified Streptomyces]EFF88447.1 regulatory protein [Streptomyces sp. e14]NED33133.1 ATP-binding protein [Streptomyces sp. SID8499]NED73602.1 ATP-binding protein [Streptomyces sp. SID9944]